MKDMSFSTSRVCPKCLGTTINVVYSSNTKNCDESEKVTEWLQCKCITCGYSFRMSVAKREDI